MSQENINEKDVARVAQWQQVWDGAYSRDISDNDPEFNIATWISSYTGEPIPPEEMQEWVSASIDPILSIHPSNKVDNRVLEIGCGTGLLLYRLLPHTSQYVGIDYSAEVLSILRKNLLSKQIKNVELHNATSTDLHKLNLGSFDTIILNSVAQYFPSLSYFEEVLKQALNLLNPGGKIFLGDLRNKDLLNVFHASVKFHRLDSGTTVEKFILAYKRKAQQDRELLFSPSYFSTLSSKYSSIQDIEVGLRRGSFQNEMTCFRYNVILGKNPPSTGTVDLMLDWKKAGLSLEKIKSLLDKKELSHFIVKGVPNARIWEYSHLVDEFFHRSQSTTLKELKTVISKRISNFETVHPDIISNLANESGYRARIYWSIDTQNAFDGIFCRN